VLRRFELSPPGNPESAAPEEYTDVTLGPKRSGLRVHALIWFAIYPLRQNVPKSLSWFEMSRLHGLR